jgi:uncharacterized protein YegJ (DUF2314 family)
MHRRRTAITISFAFVSAALLGCRSTEELVAGDEGNVELVESDDSEMNAAIEQARASLNEFIAAFQSPTPTQTYFSIKARFFYGEGGAAEHIWLEDLAFDEEHFTGALANEPVNVSGLHLGDRVTVESADISDWMIVDDGRLLGGFTIHVLRSRLTEEERREFDEETGLRIGDQPELP